MTKFTLNYLEPHDRAVDTALCHWNQLQWHSSKRTT